MRRALASVGLCAALIAAPPAIAQGEAGTDDASSTAQNLSWQSAQQAYLHTLKPADGWRFIDGGVWWRWLKYNGSDKRPSVSDTITVHYEGRLIDGTVFDSSYPRGEPARFPLGRLIPGWQVAIPKMAIGETIEIAVPADLAYGPVGRPGGPIPGNATLVFKIELVGIGAK